MWQHFFKQIDPEEHVKTGFRPEKWLLRAQTAKKAFILEVPDPEFQNSKYEVQ
jgi:hypothetical protein